MKSSEELAKEYELYFDKVTWGGFKEEKLAVKKPNEIESFISTFFDILRNFEVLLFDNLMKIEWADRQILYNGKSSQEYKIKPATDFSVAAKYFYQRYMGYGRRFWNDGIFQFLRTYADDLFPDFDNRNGLTETFVLPFENLTLEHLYCVYRMDERMEILKEANDKKLNIVQFHDYVLQYYSEMTARTGRKFKIYWSRRDHAAPYISEVFTFAERLRQKLIKKK